MKPIERILRCMSACREVGAVVPSEVMIAFADCLLMSAEFREEDHPRRDDGKFGEGAGDTAGDSDSGNYKDSPNDYAVDGSEIDSDADYGKWDDSSSAPDYQTITLHRAAKDDYLDSGYSFAESRSTAEEYQDNESFGGANLYHVSVTVSKDQIQDFRGMSTSDIAEAFDLTDPGAIGPDEWIPRNTDLQDLLRDKGIKWVRVDESFPAGTTTWMWVGDSSEEPEVHETEGKLAKKRVKPKGD